MNLIKHISLIILSFFCFNCFGQNLITEEGHKIGKWTEKIYYTDRTFRIEKGNYKIMNDDSFDIIETTPILYSKIVRYKSSQFYLHTDNNRKRIFSVKDSIWHTYDSSGKIFQIDSFSNGIRLWTKLFDTAGNLSEFNFSDFEKKS